jgi:hypothetical protein
MALPLVAQGFASAGKNSYARNGKRVRARAHESFQGSRCCTRAVACRGATWLTEFAIASTTFLVYCVGPRPSLVL